MKRIIAAVLVGTLGLSSLASFAQEENEEASAVADEYIEKAQELVNQARDKVEDTKENAEAEGNEAKVED